MIGGGVSSWLRNLSRNPGYGLRSRRKESGAGKPASPVGPTLVPGRGLRRRRPLPAGLAAARVAALLLAAAALAALAWYLVGLS